MLMNSSMKVKSSQKNKQIMGNKYILKINGMMCGMCEAHVNDVIRKNFNVKKVNSSHSKNQTIIISDENLDEELLKSKIGETGYIVEDIKREAAEEKKGFLSKLFKK